MAKGADDEAAIIASAILRAGKTARFAVIVAALLVVSPAAAQLAGIAVTPTIYNLTTGEAEIDVTVWYGGTAAFATAWLGHTSGFGIVAPAVDWQDGSTVPPLYPTGIPFSTSSTPPGAPGPVRAYRASFSHTYAVPRTHSRISVASHGLVFSTGYGFTGNSATFQTPSYSVFGGTVMLLTDRTTFFIDIDPSPLNIPAVSETGLLVLALVLAAAGVFLLRR